MTKGQSITDSEIGSEIRTDRVNKLGAILCPTICALLLVCIFAISFIGPKLIYEQYDTFCTGSRRFDVGKLYIFPNFTITFKAVTASVVAQWVVMFSVVNYVWNVFFFFILYLLSYLHTSGAQFVPLKKKSVISKLMVRKERNNYFVSPFAWYLPFLIRGMLFAPSHRKFDPRFEPRFELLSFNNDKHKTMYSSLQW